MTTLFILSGISRVLLSPLLFVLRIISTIFLPVTVISRHVSRILTFFIWLPFTLLFHLEAVYIFLGTAVIIGILTGAVLGLTTYVFTGIFYLRDELKTNTATYARSHISPKLFHDSSKRSATFSDHKDSVLGQKPSHIPIYPMLFPPSIPTILEEEDEDSPFQPVSQVRRRRGKMGNVEAIWAHESGDSSDL